MAMAIGPLNTLVAMESSLKCVFFVVIHKLSRNNNNNDVETTVTSGAAESPIPVTPSPQTIDKEKTAAVAPQDENPVNPGVKKQYNHKLDDSLIYAVRDKDVDRVKSLLAAGADPNALFEGSTPILNLGAGYGNPEIVRALLAAGADVNAKDDCYGYTALEDGTSSGNPEIVKNLLAAGADVNAKDKKGNTALGHADLMDKNDIIDLLRQHGATE